MVITDTYLENKKIMKDVIKTSFSLSDESYERFCQYIDNPLTVLNDKAKELLNKYDSEVIDFRIPLNTDSLIQNEAMKEVYFVIEVLNSVLFEFYEEYRKFDNGCSLSYESVLSNKLTVFGEERKAYRFLCSHSDKIAEHLIKNADGSAIDFFDLGKVDDFGLKLLVKTMTEYYDKDERSTHLRTKIEKIMDRARGKKVYDIGTLSSIVNDLFRIIADIIGALAISNKNKYKSFLSFNFADWFLASTGESWSSCICLDSNTCFSWGLIGLMACPDWGMIMVSKGADKNYNGIKVPSLLARSWVIYGINEKYNLVNWYPHDLRGRSTNDLVLKDGNIVITKSDFYDESRSYSWFKPFYLRNGVVPFIYADCYGIAIAKSGNSVRLNLDGEKSGIPYVSFENGAYTSKCRESFSSLCDMVGERDESMDVLIANSEDALKTAIDGPDDRYFCEFCGRAYYDSDEMNYIEGYGYVCDDCINSDSRFSYCDYCNAYFIDEHMIITADGSTICSACYESDFGSCEICGDVHIINNLNTSSFSDKVLCDDCLEEEKEEEERKRDLFCEEMGA